MKTEYTRVIDAYQRLRADREAKVDKFLSGERPYLICINPGKGDIYLDSDSRQVCFERNLAYIKACLENVSDHIPVIQPWFGTGVYANMYGCPYYWREGEAPAVRYLYHSLDEVKGLKRPRWEDSEIAELVMDTIKYFKRMTGDALPIVWTDTQSACDTATLILDACELLTGCLTEPETAMAFMQDINELIIEFSKAQAELIGDALIRPGHIIFSSRSFGGIAVSDDNISVVSPQVNRDFSFALDDAIGRAMGGVAIHCCGNWTSSMKILKEAAPTCRIVHCSASRAWDTSPNDPAQIREALKGKNLPVQVRLSGDTQTLLDEVRKLLHPDLKLIVQPKFIDSETAQRNYHALDALLGEYYCGGGQKAAQEGEAL